MFKRGKCGLLISIYILTTWIGLFAVPAFADQADPIASDAATRPAAAALQALDESFMLAGRFKSHLPVAVIGEDGSLSFHQPGEALTPQNIAAGSGPRIQASANWTEEIDGAPDREKKDYTLKLPADGAEDLTESLFDAPVYDEWTLLGNMYDKSLMRNYLALSIARELDPAVPLARFVEVFLFESGNYLYQGVYLLVAPALTEQYHMQRGKYWDADSAELDTFSQRNNILAEGLYVPTLYALDTVDFNALERVVDNAEASIFSGDYNVFSMYDRYLDLTRVYDHYLIYELFGNYGMAHLPHYIFDPKTNTYGPSTLANFEFSLDNDREEPFDLSKIAIEELPYYSSLIKSINFVDGLRDRYRLLYQGSLNSSALSERIDRAVHELGDGQLRDWARWQNIYSGETMYTLISDEEEPLDDTLPSRDRNTYSYEQEIIKLKYTLREHGESTFEGIYALYGQEKMTGNDAPYVKNTWLFIAFIFIIFLAIRFVRRRT